MLDVQKSGWGGKNNNKQPAGQLLRDEFIVGACPDVLTFLSGVTVPLSAALTSLQETAYRPLCRHCEKRERITPSSLTSLEERTSYRPSLSDVT